MRETRTLSTQQIKKLIADRIDLLTKRRMREKGLDDYGIALRDLMVTSRKVQKLMGAYESLTTLKR